ncbi:hypothetical protein BDZ91DRAFT_765299 [Kalaharituber pfeilii]|nr:hypothetical protein BDZ91DRAFT_765299 [Kalaharituber pfeilii]
MSSSSPTALAIGRSLGMELRVLTSAFTKYSLHWAISATRSQGSTSSKTSNCLPLPLNYSSLVGSVEDFSVLAQRPPSKAGSNGEDTPLRRALESKYEKLVAGSCPPGLGPHLHIPEDQPLFEAFDQKHGNDAHCSQSALVQPYICCLEDMLHLSHQLNKLESELESERHQLRNYSEEMQTLVCSAISVGLASTREGTLRMWLEYPDLTDQGSRGEVLSSSHAVVERARKLIAEGLGKEKMSSYGRKKNLKLKVYYLEEVECNTCK